MKLIQFDFKYSGPFDQEISGTLDELTRSIAEGPGLIWKICTENQAEQEAGGIYLFSDEEFAKDYIARHTVRLKEF